MWRILSKLFFKATGWKISGDYPREIKKAVMIAAPHTSNWDFFYSRAALFLMGVPVKFTIKSEWVKGPAGFVLKRLGALPIDRNKTNKQISYVDQMSRLLERRDHFVLLITPEGTRRYAPQWRTGFYYIALKAQVPILLGYLDYKKKLAGVGGRIYPSGDIERDIEQIKTFYRGISAKYPERGVR